MSETPTQPGVLNNPIKEQIEQQAGVGDKPAELPTGTEYTPEKLKVQDAEILKGPQDLKQLDTQVEVAVEPPVVEPPQKKESRFNIRSITH